ncbi:MAG TPA: hypothetical protein EYP62_02210 [Kiritimatiellae bacterium]|nr:hypothetical protein [Kiritimatiellia bacterium]
MIDRKGRADGRGMQAGLDMAEGTRTGSGGVVLAAGASRRMGIAKPLLEFPDGRRLLEVQLDVLRSGGCAPVVVVLGYQWERVMPIVPAWVRWVFNPAWERGRFSSVTAGLRVLPRLPGYVLLPVDTAGVAPDTIAGLLKFADERMPLAVRPTWRGASGRVMWISCMLAGMLVRLSARRDEFRLDHFFDSVSVRMETGDPAILNNINTPEDWRGYLARSASGIRGR